MAQYGQECHVPASRCVAPRVCRAESGLGGMALVELCHDALALLDSDFMNRLRMRRHHNDLFTHASNRSHTVSSIPPRIDATARRPDRLFISQPAAWSKGYAGIYTPPSLAWISVCAHDDPSAELPAFTPLRLFRDRTSAQAAVPHCRLACPRKRTVPLPPLPPPRCHARYHLPAALVSRPVHSRLSTLR